MNIDTLLQYLNTYGYLIIFVFLFFGIVGIPAPEESLLFLIGVLINQHSLAFLPSSLSAFMGAFTGMLTAYLVGKYVGSPFIRKYGKYVAITDERWEKVQNKYTKNVRKTILFGFYMPGIRQISPYFAGITKISIVEFLLYSIMGTILWTLPFILAGYYAGSALHINPRYVPYLGLLFLFIFLVFVFVNFLKRKRGKA
ncbi:DedA family protein [Neobacillus mesonae]|uniref:DedA family protein n=1 Tax=Neobacillus mesonae TaxID=1193713 RepID=UPI00203DB28E|nr:DedA family protein [Neobacillus mesonae]MCM3570319.1 DedA family protein [Neobacillus mesonae]